VTILRMARPSARAMGRFAWYAMAAPLFGVVAACGGDQPSAPASAPSVRFVSGNGLADTVTGTPAAPLVVRVTGADGRPMSGVQLNVSVTPGPASFLDHATSIWVDGGVPGGQRITDTTRANGELAIRLLFGTHAGVNKIAAEAPRLGLTDSTTATALPASPSHVVAANHDTTAYIGTSFAVPASVTDVYGNQRADPWSLKVASGPATASAGNLTLTGFGQVQLVIAAGSFTDSMTVRSVPRGTIAACDCHIYLDAPYQIVMVGLDGTGRRVLATSQTSGYYSEFPPSWSPDGTQVVFSDLMSTGTLERRAFITDTLGSKKRLLPGALLPAEIWPLWSPRGNWIYFQSARFFYPGWMWRVHPDGTGLELLSGDTTVNAQDTFPSPSPDGTRFAYTTTREGDIFSATRLYIGTFGSSTRVSLQRTALYPAWSPTSDLIAFLEDRGGAAGIGVVRSDGTGYRALTPTHVGGVGPPAWSPDGKYLLVIAGGGLEIVEVETGAAMLLPFTAGLQQPSWRNP
jgi:hypothetical protein